MVEGGSPVDPDAAWVTSPRTVPHSFISGSMLKSSRSSFIISSLQVRFARSNAAVSQPLVGSDDNRPESLNSTQSFIIETEATLRYIEGLWVFIQFSRFTKNMPEGQWPDFL